MKMTVPVSEMIKQVINRSGVLLIVSGEAVVYDTHAATVYIPKSQYRSSAMNLIGDFKTHLGHELLWSRHVDMDCCSADLLNELGKAGFGYKVLREDHKGTVAELTHS